MTKQIENIKEQNTEKGRSRTIIRTSVIGIIANVVLAAFKAVVGTISGSIAITLDAVNNISDAASSVITIIGTLLAGKAPDKKHPFGYGRIEYMSAMLISVIVLYAGITSFVESIRKILHPEEPDYGAVTLVIVAVAVVVKILLGLYVKKTGKRVNSDSLVNSGQDALLDSIISAATLLAAGIFLIFHLSLEAWLGAIISALIIKSGLEMLRDTVSQILGERADSSLTNPIKQTIAGFDEVHGVFDLILNNYGPDKYHASVHIEVPEDMNAMEIDELTRKIQAAVYQKHGVAITAVGVYAVNTHDDEIRKAFTTIRKIVMSHEGVLQMHGFYMNKAEKVIQFDMIIDFAVKDRKALYTHISDEVAAAFPEYKTIIQLDLDFSD